MKNINAIFELKNLIIELGLKRKPIFEKMYLLAKEWKQCNFNYTMGFDKNEFPPNRNLLIEWRLLQDQMRITFEHKEIHRKNITAILNECNLKMDGFISDDDFLPNHSASRKIKKDLKIGINVNLTIQFDPNYIDYRRAKTKMFVDPV